MMMPRAEDIAETFSRLQWRSQACKSQASGTCCGHVNEVFFYRVRGSIVLFVAVKL